MTTDPPAPEGSPVSRTPRPPHAKPRRDEILDQATRLFAERGYEGTSMADLAEHVGMRKASLFYHFASKDELYAAALDRLVVAVGNAIAAAAVAEGSFEERLDALSFAIVRVLGEQPYAAPVLVREAMDWGPVMRGALGDSIQSVLAVAEGFVRAGQQAGAFKPGDPKQLILSLVGLHFLPFSIGHVVKAYASIEPFEPAFVEQRRVEASLQVRRLMLVGS